MIRPFRWNDLPTLYRYRHRGIFLNSALAATQNSLISLAWAARLVSGEASAWVARAGDGEPTLVGRCFQPRGSHTAHLAFLAPREAANSPAAIHLIEQLTRQAGQRGAFSILAEVESASPLFLALRQAGFLPCAKQRAWRWGTRFLSSTAGNWRLMRSEDLPAVSALLRAITPERLIHAEEAAISVSPGLVFISSARLMGYAEVQSGPLGIWLRPHLHPETQNVDDALSDLVACIPGSQRRPVTICVRSYQPQIEPALEALGSTPLTEQTVLIKRIAIRQRLIEMRKLPHLENQRDAAAPLAQSRQSRYASRAKVIENA